MRAKILITYKALKIIPGSCLPLHMKYCRKEENVLYHTVTTNRKEKRTNFEEEWVNAYRAKVPHGHALRLRCPLLLTPTIQRPLQHKDKNALILILLMHRTYLCTDPADVLMRLGMASPPKYVVF